MRASLLIVPPELSIVFPAYNEQARLPVALDALDEYGLDRGLSLELIVADDGSTDATSEVVADWIKKSSREGLSIRIVNTAHRGKGGAVRAGMRHASAPVVGYCDVDMSAGVDALDKLLKAINNGADVAIASRGLSASVLVVRQPRYRELAGRLFNLCLRKVAGIPYRDTQCGLKLFRLPVAREVFRYQRVDGFAFDAEVVLLAIRLGYSVNEIPVRWAHDDRSKLTFFKDALDMSKDIVRIVRRLRAGDVHAPGVPSAMAMDRMVASENRHWWYGAKRRLVMQMLDGLPSGRCLDIGCGGGAMLVEAAGSHEVFGIDVAPQALDHAHRRGLAGLVRAEAAKLPFAAGSFQAVLVLDVLEHHARPEDLLEEARRVLAAGGRLIVTVPAFSWMWSYADHVLGHYRRYTKRELAEEITPVGFDLKRVTYFHSWLLPIAWVFRRMKALLRRPESADDFALPGPLNALFAAVSKAELSFMTYTNLPFGLSVLAVAEPKSVMSDTVETNGRPQPAASRRELAQADSSG